jgi:hypothetical protein
MNDIWNPKAPGHDGRHFPDDESPYESRDEDEAPRRSPKTVYARQAEGGMTVQ